MGNKENRKGLSKTDDCAESLASSRIVSGINLDYTGSPGCLRLLGDWFRSCIYKHVKCRSSIAGRFIDNRSRVSLPTRLIHIYKFDSDYQLRLVPTEGLRGAYAALSHCWGKLDRQPLMTTRENMPTHRNDIPMDSLPKTFRDAVIATCSLGLRRLWIDSLCIVQDDEEDWKRESLKMADVYRNASITLAATDAKDSAQGLFHRFYRSPVVVPFLQSFSRMAAELTENWIEINHNDSLLPAIMASSLGRRAWATQEWALSRRMLHFRSNGVIWSCRELGDVGIDQHKIPQPLLYLRPDWKREWETVIFWYSARKLTYVKDRLAAIEGLARELAGVDSVDKYLHGIWAKEASCQLLWYGVRGPHDRIEELSRTVPTWSWASVAQGVDFLGRHQARKSLCWFIDTFDEGFSLYCRIKDFPTSQCDVVDGQMNNARLEKLLGRKIHQRLDLYFRMTEEIDRKFYVLLDKERGTWGVFLFDNDDIPQIRASCLQISEVAAKYTDMESVFGILLVEDIPTHHFAARRIGVGVISDLAWFDYAQEKEIFLV